MTNRPGHIDREKLQHWGATRHAQSDLPRLIRRLILETTPGLVELGMPAGDGVGAGGWDGSVRTSTATAWVPDGLSVWELSVNSSPYSKADDDYSKRAETPDGTPTTECTYVAAILRPWTRRAQWATGKRNDKVWRDVRALGLDDIEAWLEAAPITWAWLSEELGLSPYGLRTGQTWWRSWSAQTDPALTTEVVLAGRLDTAKALEGRLASPGTITTVAGASCEEVCAFIAATAVDLDDKGKGQILARLAFVDDLSAWRQLTATSQPLILVPRTAELAREIPTDTVHAFCVPVFPSEGSDIVLPAVGAAEVAIALKSAGIVDGRRADSLGRLARRSLTALRRNLAIKAVLHRPTWADSGTSRDFRSILLAGSWADSVEGDRSVLEVLTGTDYESFRERIAGVADSPTDPMTILTGDTWHLVSSVDAWMLMAPKLTGDDIKRFVTVVEMVLGEGDPALDLPPDKQWRASIDGKTRRFSDDLRRGLAQSMILMAMYGGKTAASREASSADIAHHLVRKLLEWASADSTGQRWHSLADILPSLAEAGPDAFLDGVGAATAGDDPLLANLFQDNEAEPGIFMAGSPHSNLLWALECVSWSSDHFGRAVDLLARLDEIDPGGRMSNRPAASLAAIFRPWHPDSSVNPGRRVKVLDSLRQRHPESAWKLECSMIPGNYETHFPISEPQFRSWKPGKISVTYEDLWEMTTAALIRSIEDAGEDAQRWSTILACASSMRPVDRESVVAALNVMADRQQLSTSFRDSVWEALLDLIGRLRNFPDGGLPLLEEELSTLDALAARYRPQSAYPRLVRLFQSWFPYIVPQMQNNDESYRQELQRQRVEAVKEIEAEGGVGALVNLAHDASVDGSVGVALAHLGCSHDQALLLWLDSDDQDLVRTARSYFSVRYDLEGFRLITALLERADLTVDQRAELLLVARNDLPAAWARAAADPELEIAYWSAFHLFALVQDFEMLERAADRLMEFGRHVDVLYLMSVFSRIDKGEPHVRAAELIIRALNGILTGQAKTPPVPTLSADDFQQLFAYLGATREHIDQETLIRLECSYIPALGYDARVPALSARLAADPRWFVDIVCAVYRDHSADDDNEVAKDHVEGDQTDRSIATNAYLLLTAWNIPPGLVDGVMDGNALREWCEIAADLLAQRGRTEVGLQHIGQVLSHTPPDPDGTWPGFVVQEFLEEVQLDHIETGLEIQIVNSRGITSRGLEEGGEQEFKLAEDYRAKAAALADSAPRTSSLFRRVAASFESQGRMYDEEAERVRRGVY